MSNILELLERHEGYRRFVYKDTQGIETVGIGRNLRNRGITHAEALYLLGNDVDDFTQQLRDSLYWFDSIHPDAQTVLICMAFNMGVSGLMSFHDTLEHIKNENYKAASETMLQSKWARQVGKRAIELSEILKQI